MRALSIRQPWAWLIVNGFKKIENRTWNTNKRGRFFIHASSKRPSAADYDVASEICRNLCINLPPIQEFELGAIVGYATLVDVKTVSGDPFFFGPFGHMLKDAVSIKPIRHKGALSFFNVPYAISNKGEVVSSK